MFFSACLGVCLILGAPKDEVQTPLSNSNARPNEARPQATVRPPVLKLRKDVDRIGYRITIRPGVPEPESTVSLEVELAELFSIPDPTFGKRKPLEDANIRAILIAQNESVSKKSAKTSSWAEARTAVKLPNAGTFGFTFTVGSPGFYSLYLRGESKTAGTIAYDTILPVGLWPIPDEISSISRPPLTTEPTAQRGDLNHGRSVCSAFCRTDIQGAWPQGATPTFLPSSFALALSDEQIIADSLKKNGPKLSVLQRNDLIYYIRSLHWKITDFFPEATDFVAQSFTINSHGLERLQESLKISLSDKETNATVFVAFAVDQKGKADPSLIDFKDRIGRDRLKAKFRLGYLLFTSMPGEPRAKELAIAMSREPVYSITGLKARDADGKIDVGFNKQLQSFVGLGHFNDPRSLRKGLPTLEKKILPIYLTAAEQATMYYGAEREFAEFDAEFGEGDAASAEGGELKVKVSK